MIKFNEMAEKAVNELEFSYDDITLYTIEDAWKRGFNDALEHVEKQLSNGVTLQQALWEIKLLTKNKEQNV